MTKINPAEAFIRLLTEAYEAHCATRKVGLSAQNKAQLATFRHKQLTAMYRFRDAMEPLDCVQLAVVETRDGRFPRRLRDERL